MTNLTLNNEKELHSLIEKELDALEEGLILLKYEMEFRTGTPDFLCADSGGRLVVIEVKLHEDDSMLFQALRYYDEVDRNRFVIAQHFQDKHIDPSEHPRVMLIAKTFSESVRRLSSLVKPVVEPYRYVAVRDSNGQMAMVFVPVPVPMTDEPPSEPTDFKDHLDYTKKEELQPLFKEARKRMLSLSSKIEEYFTQAYIGYKYKGRMLAWISRHRKSFDVGANVVDDNGETIDDESVRIEDENGDYDHILHRTRESLRNLESILDQ